VLGKWIDVPEDQRQNFVPQTETATAEAILPDLPGIDTQTGLARVGNNSKLYRNILLKFRSSQIDIAEQIEQALAADDSQTAERLAHTLKGVCGNVGADKLQEAARVLEAAIRDRQNKTEIELAAVRSELVPVMAALEKLDQVAPVTEQTVTAPDMDEIRPLLGRLRSLLEDDDAGATEVLETVQQRCAGSTFATAFDPLAQAIGEYDFESALEYLDELVVRLEAD